MVAVVQLHQLPRRRRRRDKSSRRTSLRLLPPCEQ